MYLNGSQTLVPNSEKLAKGVDEFVDTMTIGNMIGCHEEVIGRETHSATLLSYKYVRAIQLPRLRI